jgi:predicted esterase
MKVLTFCFVIFLAGVSNLTYAQQTAKKSPAGTCYLEYLPDGYNSNTNNYPIVISLHGIGEKGNTLTDVTKVANVSLAKYVKQGTKYPFLIISPQLKTSMGRWTGDYVMEVVNYVKTYLRVDATRIYLTGLSLGGGGVWSVSTSYPDVFAAIVPICSGYNVTASACKLAASNVPVWAFHGDKDATVGESVTINMINAINNCSPKPAPLSKMTIFPGLGHMIWDKVYKETDAINWMLGFRNGTTTTDKPVEEPIDDYSNVAPVAKAGSDKTITLPTSSMTINGSATDSDGTISSYTWTKSYGGTVTMSGTSTKDLALSNLKQGSYIFVLTVTDNKGGTDTDAMKVTVNAATTTTNTAPVASAGSDKTITLPTNTITLNGSGSDTDGSISSYTWTKTAGGTASMSGTTTPTLNVSNLAAGSYSFQLTVKDDDGSSDSDVVVVTVKSSTVNQAPVANAGPNKSITLPTTSSTIYGSGSDSDGTISSYTWRKRSGGTVTMSGTTSKDLKVSNLKEGSYVFELTVKDNNGATHIDAMLLNVLSSTAK